MGYKIGFEELDNILHCLQKEYDIYAPKRFSKRGRWSDTDVIKYDRIDSVSEIVFDEKSTYPAKEVVDPITQTIFYFTEDEYRESKASDRKILIFMRPCDINAREVQKEIFLNNKFEDSYYKRVSDKVKIIMMECVDGWDTCFCTSMGSNKTDKYDMAVRFLDNEVLLKVKNNEFESYFEKSTKNDFEPAFIEKNDFTLEIPNIPNDNKEVLTKLKTHELWNEYNKRCVSCGACTLSCSTCTCFTTTDIFYNENKNAGERRRTSASCQIAGFDHMSGGHSFRTNAASRMRYKVLHKIHDYKARFGKRHMCIGCGRCTDNCPEAISFTATVEKVNKAVKEIIASN